MSSISVTHQGDVTTVSDGSKSIVWLDNNKDGRFNNGDDVVEAAKIHGSAVMSWRVGAGQGTTVAGDPHAFKFYLTQAAQDSIQTTLGHTLETARQGGAVNAADLTAGAGAYETAAFADARLIGHMHADFVYVQANSSRLKFEMVKADPAANVTFVNGLTVASADGQAVVLNNIFTPGDIGVSSGLSRDPTALLAGKTEKDALLEFHEVAGTNIAGRSEIFGEYNGKIGTILSAEGKLNNSLGTVNGVSARAHDAYQKNDRTQMAAFALSLQSDDGGTVDATAYLKQVRADQGWDRKADGTPNTPVTASATDWLRQMRLDRGWRTNTEDDNQRNRQPVVAVTPNPTA